MILFFLAQLLFSPLSNQNFVEIRDHKFFVEVVRSPDEWQKGLMFRENLLPNQGMFFWGKRDLIQSFWMKNTLISLDILFIDKNLKVVKIHHQTTPFSEKPLSSVRPARHVLEIKGGEAKRRGLKEGDGIKIFFGSVNAISPSINN